MSMVGSARPTRRLTSLLPMLLRATPDASGFQDCEQRLSSGESRKLHVRRVTLANADAVSIPPAPLAEAWPGQPARRAPTLREKPLGG